MQRRLAIIRNNPFHFQSIFFKKYWLWCWSIPRNCTFLFHPSSKTEKTITHKLIRDFQHVIKEKIRKSFLIIKSKFPTIFSSNAIIRQGCLASWNEMWRRVVDNGLDNRVNISLTKCFGFVMPNCFHSYFFLRWVIR